MKVESIRVDFFQSTRAFSITTDRSVNAAISAAVDSLIRLESDLEFVEIAQKCRFRISAPNSLRDEIPNALLEDISVYEAIISSIITYETNIEPQLQLNLNGGIKQLKEILPDQRIAPAQFDIENNKLRVRHQKPTPDPADENNIASARHELIERGKNIIDQLSKSNCDKRLIESLTDLQNCLEANQDVVRLGLVNIGCEAVSSMFECELPDAIRGLIKGQNIGVGMLVAQYPEWQQFSEKAASTAIDENDIKSISNAAKAIVEVIHQNPQLAEPEVPRTISALQSLIEDPQRATKRAAFALLRTIENLIARTFRFGLEFFEKTAQKTVDDLSSATSKVVVGSLMAIALAGAVGLTPLASKVADTAWVKTAADLVKAQIEALE